MILCECAWFFLEKKKKTHSGYLPETGVYFSFLRVLDITALVLYICIMSRKNKEPRFKREHMRTNIYRIAYNVIES